MGFVDMRQRKTLVEKEGELRRITAEVGWDREIGAVARRGSCEKGARPPIQEHQRLCEW